MRCIGPQALSDDDISAAIDNAAPDSGMSHLSECPFCRERLEKARRTEQQLAQSLPRWACPVAKNLSLYALALVSSDQDRTIRAHLEQCALCRTELDDLRQFLDQELELEPHKSPERPRQSRTRDIIARLMPSRPALA